MNQRMHTVVETTMWQKSTAAIWSEDERDEFVDFISRSPKAGDVIPGTRALRKVRWQRKGIGKRGGIRIIYFMQNERSQVVLLMAYAKAKFDNLPIDYLNALKEKYFDQ